VATRSAQPRPHNFLLNQESGVLKRDVGKLQHNPSSQHPVCGTVVTRAANIPFVALW